MASNSSTAREVLGVHAESLNLAGTFLDRFEDRTSTPGDPSLSDGNSSILISSLREEHVDSSSLEQSVRSSMFVLLSGILEEMKGI